MKKINYHVHRDNIKDGQLVFIGGDGKNKIQKLIQFVTRGQFTHMGFTVWVTDDFGHRRLMILESTIGGVRLANLSSYLNRKVVLADTALCWCNVHDYAMGKAGFVHYGMEDFIIIGIREMLIRNGLPKLASKLPDAEGQVCSEFTADVMNQDEQFAQYNIPTLVSPNGLFKILHNLGLLLNLVELTLDDSPTRSE